MHACSSGSEAAASSCCYPCQSSAATEDLRTERAGQGASARVLNLHVGLIWLVHDVLPLLVHHLSLAMLCVHHGHLATVVALRWVALLRTDRIRAVRRRSVVLLMLGWALALYRLVVHGYAHVSLVLGSVRRRMRRRRTVP